MYRQIFTPTESNSSLPPVTIPREWYGNEVEMIIFPVNLFLSNNNDIDPDLVKERRRKREEMLKKYSFNMSNFKFDRDEVNNYE